MNGSLIWGPHRLRREDANHHFLVTGTTGSGKTTLVEVLLQSAFEDEYSLRGFFYDPKQEVIPILDGLGELNRTFILNPFDARRSAWNLYQDIVDPISARELATILIPSQTRSTDSTFFESASRQILTAVINGFIYCFPERRWTFRDILLVTLDRQNLELFVDSAEANNPSSGSELRRTYEAFLSPQSTDPRTADNIHASLSAYLAHYEPVAQAWHTATRSFSLSEWLSSAGDHLVLGSDVAAEASLLPINQAILQRAIQLVLQREELGSGERPRGTNQTWFVFDEFRELGDVRAMGSLLSKGRSRGAVVVLSFQDIDGLNHIYGKERANEMVANCSNIAILKTTSATTAEWAAGMFGKRLVAEWQESEGMASEGLSRSFTVANQERNIAMTADILSLPLPGTERGLIGFFRDTMMPKGELPLKAIDWADLLKLKPAHGEEPGFLPIDRRQLLLEPFSDEERLVLLGERRVKDIQTPKSPGDVLDSIHRHQR